MTDRMKEFDDALRRPAERSPKTPAQVAARRAIRRLDEKKDPFLSSLQSLSEAAAFENPMRARGRKPSSSLSLDDSIEKKRM